MARTMMLVLTLLASVGWVQAQGQYPQSNPDEAGNSTSSASGETTVQGCSQGANGSYTQTSDSGSTYRLQGDTSKLSEHVGHEVAIIGTTAPSSAAASPSGESSPHTSSSASTSGTSQNTPNVQDVKHISKTCTNVSK